MPKLIAKERFYYAGRNVEVDEEFDADAQDVAILTTSVSPRARKPPEVRTAAIEPTPVPTPALAPFQAPPATHKHRQYLRRDMRAKD